MDQAKTPAAAPPPGIPSNFVDPETGSGATIAVSVVMLFLILVVVSGRLYHSACVSCSVGLDDYMSLVAVVAMLFLNANLTLLSIVAGTSYWLQLFGLTNYLFRHQWDVPISWFTERKAKSSFAQSMFLGPTTFFAKASLLLLYLRIFSGTKRSFRFMIYGTLVFCFCLYWVNLPLELYFCMPRGGQAWSDRPVLMKCARTIIFGIVQGIINVLLDLWLMMIPFHIVWNLQMRRSKKILISAIFMTGILGCIASVIGLVYRIEIFRTMDGTWNQGILFLAIICEIDIAIICGAMPSFAALIKHALSGKSPSSINTSYLSINKLMKRLRLTSASRSSRRLESSYLELSDRKPLGDRPQYETQTGTSRAKHARDGTMRSVDLDISYQGPSQQISR